MKLTFSQSIILACVASSALTAAVPAFPLEAREPRRVHHRKVTDVTAVATDATAAYTSPNLVGRSAEDGLLVEREPARGRSRSRGRAHSRGPSQNTRNAAQGIGAFVGAAGAQQLNQQQNQNAARSIDLDEFDIETRDFEDNLIFERSPKRGGKGRGRSHSRGPSQNSRQAAQGVGALIGAVGAQQMNQQNTQDNAARSLDVDEFSLEAREFDDDLLWERAPITGAERVRRFRKRHPGWGRSGHHAVAGSTSSQGNTARSLDVDEFSLEAREFDDDLLLERSPVRGLGRSRSNRARRQRHHRHNHMSPSRHGGMNRHRHTGANGGASAGGVADGASSGASEDASNMQTRDFEDYLLVERSPKGGKGGKGRGRARSHAHNAGSIITEAAGAAGAEAAANLQTRDFEDDLLFERSPKGGKGGKGRGRARGHAHNAGSVIAEAAGAAGAEAAANLQTRDFEDELLFERSPKGGKGGKGRGRARSHAHNAGSIITEAAGAAGAEAAANLQTRGFWEALVQRSPKGGKGGKGRGRARSHAHNAGSVIAEAAGAAGAEAANNLQTREFEDDLLFERSPKGGKGGKGRGRARSHAHNAGSVIAEAAGAAGAEAAANLQTR